MSHLSTAELDIQAARELIFALRNPVPVAPFTHIGHQQHDALARLTMMFEEIAYPEGPPPDLDPVPATTPSVMPSPIQATAPSAKQTFTPSPRVAAPLPRVDASLPRVHVPVATPNAHRRINPTIRTPMPSPKFDLYKHRRHTMISASRHQSPVSEPQVANRVVDYLAPTTRHIMDDIQAENHRYNNTRSQTLLNISNHVSTFVPNTNTSINTNYYMPMANEVTHPITGEALTLQEAPTGPSNAATFEQMQLQ
jgi:hypothetical protein